MAIYGLQVMACIWYRELVFGKKSPVLIISFFQAENFLTSPLKGEGRALPLPYKQQIIDRYGYFIEIISLEI